MHLREMQLRAIPFTIDTTADIEARAIIKCRWPALLLPPSAKYSQLLRQVRSRLFEQSCYLARAGSRFLPKRGVVVVAPIKEILCDGRNRVSCARS